MFYSEAGGTNEFLYSKYKSEILFSTETNSSTTFKKSTTFC